MFSFQLLNSVDWSTRFFNTSFIEEFNCENLEPCALEKMHMNAGTDWVQWDDSSKSIPLTLLENSSHIKTSFDLLKIQFLNYLYCLDLTAAKIKTMSFLYDFQSDIYSYRIR